MRAPLVRLVITALCGAASNKVNVSAFVTPSRSSHLSRQYTSGSIGILPSKVADNSLFLDASGGLDVASALSNAWASYNVALEEDPLLTK